MLQAFIILSDEILNSSAIKTLPSFNEFVRLPFLKMRLEYNKRNNLEKKLDITLDEIYKQTGTLITRIDNFPSQFRNISHREYNE